ncbi:MarR family winged helix-turn-helix transcriptional regulator [Lactococcus allomyrinae]|uniref:MarR family transcriptional regulator n=1 Tax=Lactococcus allomyrinae TaxID=2419773 RepID=A0A387BKB6_9LACT|nr:MarR family transcriptional regulator [Lactococcus allomyrinae]AYG01477.1 MarR family transcriptional regulator [Lactococcus allomyrinae]
MNKIEERNLTKNFMEYTQLMYWVARKKMSFRKQVGTRLNRMVGQGQILGILEEESPISQRDLVARLDMKPQSASEIIRKLEKKGLISRWQSPEDKRVYIVSLTPAGEKEIDQFDEFVDVSPILLEGLDDDEKVELMRLIQKMRTSLDAQVEKEGGKLRGQYQRFARNPKEAE